MNPEVNQTILKSGCDCHTSTRQWTNQFEGCQGYQVQIATVCSISSKIHYFHGGTMDLIKIYKLTYKLTHSGRYCHFRAVYNQQCISLRIIATFKYGFIRLADISNTCTWFIQNGYKLQTKIVHEQTNSTHRSSFCAISSVHQMGYTFHHGSRHNSIQVHYGHMPVIHFGIKCVKGKFYTIINCAENFYTNSYCLT